MWFLLGLILGVIAGFGGFYAYNNYEVIKNAVHNPKAILERFKKVQVEIQEIAEETVEVVEEISETIEAVTEVKEQVEETWEELNQKDVEEVEEDTV